MGGDERDRTADLCVANGSAVEHSSWAEETPRLIFSNSSNRFATHI